MDSLRLLMVGFYRNCGGDTSQKPEEENLKIKFIAYTIISPTIVSLGVICNCLNLLVLSYSNIFKGATKIYIMALTIADLCALLALLPVLERLNKVHSQTYAASIYYAHFEVYFVEIFIKLSTFIVISLSFDRYLAVCLPEKFNNFHSKKTAIRVVISCCIFAICIGIPFFFAKEPCRLPRKYGNNLWDTRANATFTRSYWWKIYVWSYEIITGYGGFFLLAFFNLSIIFRYKRYMKKKLEVTKSACVATLELKELDKPNLYLQRRKQREEYRIVLTLQVIVLLFFFTMAPSAVLSIIYYTAGDSKTVTQYCIIRAIGNNLLMLYLTLNFFIYSFCHKKFRARLKDMMCKC